MSVPGEGGLGEGGYGGGGHEEALDGDVGGEYTLNFVDEDLREHLSSSGDRMTSTQLLGKSPMESSNFPTYHSSWLNSPKVVSWVVPTKSMISPLRKERYNWG